MKKTSRKHFLQQAIATGAVLSLPTVLQQCSSLPQGRFKGSDLEDPLFAANQAGLKEPLLQILATGATAPNPHNVQPWKIQIRNDSECYLFADVARLLPLTDPSARQIHIGQGTFLEHVALGAGKAGYSTKIKILPKGKYNPLNPQKPVAKITIEKDSNATVDPLYNAIALRSTNRKVYDDYKPSLNELMDVKKVLGRSYGKLKFETSTSKLNDLNHMFFQAMSIECNTERTYEESRAWFRYNDKEIYKKRDGISLRTGGMNGLKLWFVTRLLEKGKKAWNDPSNVKIYLDGFQVAMQSTKAVAFLETQSNQLYDWIRCGRDYARLHLALTQRGLVMHPLSQILQEYSEMDQLYKKLHDLRGVHSPSRIQMAVRIGKASPAFITPRRDLKDMIRK